MGLMHNKALWLTLMSGSSASAGAMALLAGETQGLALDFTDAFYQGSTGFYGSAAIRDTTTPANNYDSSPTQAATSLLTYTSPSPKMTMGPSGTLRYQAHNLWTNSESFASQTLSFNSFTSTTGNVVSISALNAFQYRTQAGLILGASYQVSLDVTCSATATVGIRMFDAGAQVFYAQATACVAGVTQRITTSVFVPTGLANINIGVDQRAAIIPGVSDLTGQTVTINRVHVRRTPSDSTYLATTTTARYALPLEWNTSGVLQGMLVEEARTNLCLWSDDLTNAAWTKSNLTTAKTAIGPDGVANSATTCTATAGNATALQAITSGSAARVTHVWLKRITGTGNIDLTQDNGSTWATQTITSSWAKYALATVTSANPTVGIRVVTSGDAVDVALFNHDVGAFATSSIQTFASTVTRFADSIRAPVGIFPYNQPAGTLFIEFATRQNLTGRIANLAGNGGDPRIVDMFMSGGSFTSFNGTGNLSPSGTPTANTTYKISSAYQTGSYATVLNGGTAATRADATINTATNIYIGSFDASGSNNLNGYIRRMLYLPRRMSNAELQTLTTP